MKLLRHYVVTLTMVLMVVACGTLGLVQPKSLGDRIAYQASQVTAARNATTAAITAGDLQPADGDRVLKLTDDARLFLDSARLIASTNPGAAEAKLTLAVGVLTAAQAYLRKPTHE